MGRVQPGQRFRRQPRTAATVKQKKRKAPKKLKRNPVARMLASGKFASRVVKPFGLYKRRPKHPPAADDTD